MAAFNEGDRVAWDHQYATDHAPESVVREDAVRAKAPDAKFGVVTGVENEEGTYFAVKLDEVDEPLVLTLDELVKVSG